jgi:hypothetical protein
LKNVLEAAKCSGVKSLKAKEIRGKYQRHSTTENQQFISNNNAVKGAIPVFSHVDGGVVRQQQLHDLDVTPRTRGGGE